MMWMDRDQEEHQIYDHFSIIGGPTDNRTQQPNGGVASMLVSNSSSGGGNGIYQQHSSTPTTTNSMALESSLGGGSPPPVSMGELDNDGSSSVHQHATLPAMDHRLPMDNHHLEDDQQNIYEPQQHLYHHLQHHLPIDPDDPAAQMMVTSASGLYGDHHETAMMMSNGSNGDIDYFGGTRHINNHIDDGALVKVTHSKPKEKKNYLQIYARQFGLNDRGCYVSLGLAALAFL